MNFRKAQNLTGFIVFLLSSIVYLLTMQPNISFWDNSEYAAGMYTLSIPHQPGAPLWILIGRIASMLPFGSNPAVKINIITALIAGITVYLVYLIIIRLINSWKGYPSEKWDSIILYTSAAIGALSIAFSYTFWFNAIDSGIYTAGSLLTALCIWLLLYWWEKSDEEGCDRILLLIAFIAGVSLGIQLSVMLVIPAAALMYYFKRFEYSLYSFILFFILTCVFFLLLYPVIVDWYPSWLGGNISLFKIYNSGIISVIAVLIFIALIIGSYFLYQKKRSALSLITVSLVFIIFGYTVYTSVLLRAQTGNLPINESNPANMEALSVYMERGNSGSPLLWPRRYVEDSVHSSTWTNYSGNFDFLWRYQANHMFTRYLGWQYIGLSSGEAESGIDWNKLYGIPLLIGLFGLFYHFRKDWKPAFAFLWLFLLLGILSALYLRQQSPQPRERDYIYSNAFLIFSIWIGIGVMGLLELIREYLHNQYAVKTITSAVLIAAFIFIPLNMLRVNYQSHDRHNNFFTFNYAYNMLQSTAEDGILFTNGDNDTYPLWYLQSIGYRRDVSVINLALLNSPWYVNQLKNDAPYGVSKLTINLTNEQIDKLSPVQWNDPRIVSISVPKEALPDSVKEREDTTFKITWKMPATIKYNDVKGIRIQDIFLYEILRSNNWVRPVYFSISIPENDCIGLKDYLVAEGLVRHLVPSKIETEKQFRVNEQVMYNNMVMVPPAYSKTPQTGYVFSGLNLPGITYTQTELELIQNYRTQYLMLAYSFLDDDSTRAAEVLTTMDENIPQDVIPMNYKLLYENAMLYYRLGNKNSFNRIYPDIEKPALADLDRNPGNYKSYNNPYMVLIDIYEASGNYRKALDILSKLDEVTSGNPEIKMKMDALRTKMQNP